MSQILFLVSSMEGGGAERVAALLSNHWVAQGHQVTLMPTFSGRGDCSYALDERVRLDYLADRVGSRSGSPLNKLRRMMALRRAIRDEPPAVVLSFLPHVNVAAVVASLGLRVPVVVSERIYPPAMPLGAVLERLRRWAYARATKVVVQTEETREWLACSCPGARVHVIANPLVYPLPQSQPRVDPDHIVGHARPLALAVGRLEKQKGFDLLIAAFQRLSRKYSTWDLAILGEGIERPQLERYIESLGLTDRIFFAGRAGNLADWYTRADFYVMSSRFEGFPNTLLEAMAYGLPAVSFDCQAGPRDIIRDGVDGLLVAPDAGVSGLSAAMERLMGNGELRRQMSDEAVSVRERFALEQIAAQWDVVLGLRRAQ